MTNIFQNVIINLFLQSSVLKFVFSEIIINRFGTKKTQIFDVYKNSLLFMAGKTLLKNYQLMRKLIFIKRFH